MQAWHEEVQREVHPQRELLHVLGVRRGGILPEWDLHHPHHLDDARAEPLRRKTRRPDRRLWSYYPLWHTVRGLREGVQR